MMGIKQVKQWMDNIEKRIVTRESFFPGYVLFQYPYKKDYLVARALGSKCFDEARNDLGNVEKYIEKYDFYCNLEDQLMKKELSAEDYEQARWEMKTDRISKQFGKKDLRLLSNMFKSNTF